MNLGQASLGSTPSINLGGYIPAPAYHPSVLSQALTAFLANAGGALATRAVGAGANAMGAFTPEEVAAKQQMAEIARHNVAGEDLGAREVANRETATAADIENMRKMFGLNQTVGLGNLDLGKQRIGLEGQGLAETGRHNVATEAEAAAALEQNKPLVGAETRHLNAQAGTAEAGTAMQEHVQKSMALQELLKGTDGKGPQAALLNSAAAKVPFDGNIESWSAKVRAQAAQDAQAALGSGAGPQAAAAPTSSPITTAIAERGLLPAIGAGLQNFEGGEPNHGMQADVNIDAIKRFLMGGPSRFDLPTKR